MKLSAVSDGTLIGKPRRYRNRTHRRFYLAGVRKLLHKRQHGRCHYCRNKVARDRATIDHVIPRSKGGSDEVENLVMACAACNAAKGDAVP